MSVFAEKRERGCGQPIEHGKVMSGVTRSGESGETAGEDGSTSIGETQPLAGTLADIDPSALSDIEELARIRLQHSPYRAIRKVGCTFANGVLTLTGVVPTFHYKQLAQTAVVNISGVRNVVNLIDVG